jgi:hypothetical protein
MKRKPMCWRKEHCVYRKLCKNEKTTKKQKKNCIITLVLLKMDWSYMISLWTLREKPKRNENMEKFTRGCWAWSND